jgi:NAD+ diphosphatase
MRKPVNPSGSNLGPWPLLGYVDSPLDRAHERRVDFDFLSARIAEDSCGFYLVSGEMVLLKAGGGAPDPLFRTAEIASLANGNERIFLGLLQNAARFGLPVAAEAVEPLKADPRFVVSDLRSIAVQGLIAPEHLSPLAEAKALLHWHARHRFCANCGHPTDVTDGGWRRDCPQCHYQHFPRTDPVAIMLAVRGDQCLLGRQSRFATGMWSCLAGFIEPGESIEDAARRETLEEAGIVCGRVRYFASQPWPFPSSLMIGCHAEALSSDIKVDYGELEDARWFMREEAAAMLMRRHPDGLSTPPPVAIAHHIIRAWVEKGDGVFA